MREDRAPLLHNCVSESLGAPEARVAPVPLSSADASAVVVLALIVLVMVRRTYALSQGTVYGPVRVFAYSGFSMFLFGFFAASTVYVAVGTWGTAAYALLAPYAAIVAGAALAVEPRIRPLVRFEDRADGSLYYHLPLVVPVLSLGLFLARLAVEIALFGLSAIAAFSFPTTLPLGALELLIAFDLLFGLSIGLLIGRGLAVRRAFLARSTTPHAPLRGA
jgi:hypothetical protein